MVRSVRDASESSFALPFYGPREAGLPSVAVIKHRDEKQGGRGGEGLFHLTGYSPSSREFRGRT